MKTTQIPLIKVEKTQLQELCKEVKETLATEVHIKTLSKQAFGVADLWNIHRNTRYRVQRRNLMF